MASDAIEICNQALALVGGNLIQSLDDGSTEADYCRAFYEPTVRAMIEDHPWNFAERTAVLPREATAGELDFSYSYALPSGFISVRELMNGSSRRSSQSYEIRGLSLATDESGGQVRYTWRAPEQYWPAKFAEAVTFALASKLAMPLAESTERADYFRSLATNALAVARSRDSAKDSAERFDTSLLIASRYY